MMSRLALLVATAGSVALMAQSPPTVLVPPASPHAAANVSYVDVTATAGLAGFRHVSGSPEKPYLIETTGSGVAMADFDDDGLVDIYLVNGSTLDRIRTRSPAPKAALFRNAGNGTFRDVTDAAGVANERWGQGVCLGDFDNDGREDFYVTNFGANRLYRSVGDARFLDVAVAARVAVDSWSTGCAFGDYDGDGWLDLYVAGYVDFDVKNPPPAPGLRQGSGEAGSGGAKAPPPHTSHAGGAKAPPPQTTQAPPPRSQAQAPRGGTGMGASYTAGATVCTYRGQPVMCGPRGLKGAPDHLFRNNRDGTFTDVTADAGVTDTKRLYGFGVAWFDMDDDGRLDLIVANDSGPNYIYRNLGNGTFEDVSYPSGAALDGNGRDQAHMGVAIGDYDNDGRDDIHITNFADDFNVLYRNHDGASFNDVSFRAGVAQISIPFLGWGTDFLDYDNDGWRDLLVVNGHVYPMADRLDWNTTYAQRALLWRNLAGKRFEEIGEAAGSAVTTPRVSRGSAVGDFDNDGGVDFVVNTIDGPPLLARNDGAGRGHWVTVQLRGDPARKCPRDAIGSVVFVTAGGVRMRGEVASGRGQVSQSDLRVHFGLGASTKITSLEVRWANGPTVKYTVPRIDAVITIDQTSGVL
jgi:enediyne biosynthesis protein E4